jgi:hypothetical protein
LFNANDQLAHHGLVDARKVAAGDALAKRGDKKMLSANELKPHREFYHSFLKVLGTVLAVIAVLLVIIFSLITR